MTDIMTMALYIGWFWLCSQILWVLYLAWAYEYCYGRTDE